MSWQNRQNQNRNRSRVSSQLMGKSSNSRQSRIALGTSSSTVNKIVNPNFENTEVTFSLSKGKLQKNGEATFNLNIYSELLMSNIEINTELPQNQDIESSQATEPRANVVVFDNPYALYQSKNSHNVLGLSKTKKQRMIQSASLADRKAKMRYHTANNNKIRVTSSKSKNIRTTQASEIDMGQSLRELSECLGTNNNQTKSTVFNSQKSTKASTQMRFFQKNFAKTNKSGKLLRTQLSNNIKTTRPVTAIQNLQFQPSVGKKQTERSHQQLEYVDLLKLFVISNEQVLPLKIHPTYLIEAQHDLSLPRFRFVNLIQTSQQPVNLITRGQYQVKTKDLTDHDAKQVLLEMISKISQAQQSETMDQDETQLVMHDVGKLDFDKPVGVLMAQNAQKAAISIRDFISIDSFKKALKRCALSNFYALQLDPSFLDGTLSSITSQDKRRHSVFGNQIIIQKFAYKGYHERQGRVDKLWTSLVDKMIYLRLIRDKKLNQLSKYSIQVETQRRPDLINQQDDPQSQLLQSEALLKLASANLTEVSRSNANTVIKTKSTDQDRPATIGSNAYEPKMNEDLGQKSKSFSEIQPTTEHVKSQSDGVGSPKESEVRQPMDLQKVTGRILQTLRQSFAKWMEADGSKDLEISQCRFVFEIAPKTVQFGQAIKDKQINITLLSIDDLQVSFQSSLSDKFNKKLSRDFTVAMNSGATSQEPEIEAEAKTLTINPEDTKDSLLVKSVEQNEVIQLRKQMNEDSAKELHPYSSRPLKETQREMMSQSNETEFQKILAEKQLYHGLTQIALNYGKESRYIKPIVEKPINRPKSSFVQRQQNHIADKNKLLLQKNRITPQNAPKRSFFMSNYPLYMEKQGSAKHAKFLFGTNHEPNFQMKSNKMISVEHGSTNLLKRYQSVHKNRDRADKYFQFEKRQSEKINFKVMGPAFMTSKNFNQHVADSGGELVFGGLKLANYEKTQGAQDGHEVAFGLGKTKMVLLEEQRQRDLKKHAKETKYSGSNPATPGKCLPDELSSNFMTLRDYEKDKDSIDVEQKVLKNYCDVNGDFLDETLSYAYAMRPIDEKRDLSVMEPALIESIKRKYNTTNPSVLTHGKVDESYEFNQKVREQIRYLNRPKELNLQFRVNYKVDSKPELTPPSLSANNNDLLTDILNEYRTNDEPFLSQEIMSQDGQKKHHKLDLKIDNNFFGTPLENDTKLQTMTKEYENTKLRVQSPNQTVAIKLEKQGSSLSTKSQAKDLVMHIQGKQMTMNSMRNREGNFTPRVKFSNIQKKQSQFLEETVQIKIKKQEEVEEVLISREWLHLFMKNLEKFGSNQVIEYTESSPKNQDMIKVEILGHNQLIYLSQKAYEILMKIQKLNFVKAHESSRTSLQSNSGMKAASRMSKQRRYQTAAPAMKQATSQGSISNGGSTSQRKVVLSTHHDFKQAPKSPVSDGPEQESRSKSRAAELPARIIQLTPKDHQEYIPQNMFDQIPHSLEGKVGRLTENRQSLSNKISEESPARKTEGFQPKLQANSITKQLASQDQRDRNVSLLSKQIPKQDLKLDFDNQILNQQRTPEQRNTTKSKSTLLIQDEHKRNISLQDIFRGTQGVDEDRLESSKLMVEATQALEEANIQLFNQQNIEIDLLFEQWKQKQRNWISACLMHNFKFIK